MVDAGVKSQVPTPSAIVAAMRVIHDLEATEGVEIKKVEMMPGGGKANTCNLTLHLQVAMKEVKNDV